MKNIFIIILFLCYSVASFSQQQNDVPEKQRYLKMVTAESTIIFEGKVIKKNKSFWGNGEYKETIFTSYTVQVDAVLFGNIQVGTIEIVEIGGQLDNTSMRPSHGDGLCSGSGTFFCKPFGKGSSGVVNSNPGDYNVVANYCDSKMTGGDPNEARYVSKEELYKDLGTFQSVTVPVKKKALNVEEEKKSINKSEESFDYEQNVRNYDANLSQHVTLVKCTQMS